MTFGHIIYSIAGYFYHHDILWVFNKIPYAKLSSSYGSGELFHFVYQLIIVVGVPIYILFWIGFISLILKSVKNKVPSETSVLILLSFIVFFTSHSLFWYYGIFNSMGLIRVLVGIAPLISLIALLGYNSITEDVLKNKRKVKLLIQGILILYICIFPFTPNHGAVHWNRDMSLSAEQLSVIDASHVVKQHSVKGQKFVYAHPYLSETLHIDHFDSNKRIDFLTDFMLHLNSGDIIIWDSWFSKFEQGIQQETLSKNPKLIKIFTTSDTNQRVYFSIYKRK